MENNLVHGKGTYIWEEGKRYEGEFLHGKKHGDGTFYLNNELVYEGLGSLTSLAYLIEV